MTTTAQPFPKSEMARVPFIDSLRGFALLGSLLMNIIGFPFPFPFPRILIQRLIILPRE